MATKEARKKRVSATSIEPIHCITGSFPYKMNWSFGCRAPTSQAKCHQIFILFPFFPNLYCYAPKNKKYKKIWKLNQLFGVQLTTHNSNIIICCCVYCVLGGCMYAWSGWSRITNIIPWHLLLVSASSTAISLLAVAIANRVVTFAAAAALAVLPFKLTREFALLCELWNIHSYIHPKCKIEKDIVADRGAYQADFFFAYGSQCCWWCQLSLRAHAACFSCGERVCVCGEGNRAIGYHRPASVHM